MYFLFLILNPQAKELGKCLTTNPSPASLNVIEMEVVAITTIVSNDFTIFDKVL